MRGEGMKGGEKRAVGMRRGRREELGYEEWRPHKCYLDH
jgi:hypothetical protein